jgi:hypothetical protein
MLRSREDGTGVPPPPEKTQWKLGLFAAGLIDEAAQLLLVDKCQYDPNQTREHWA